LGSYIIETVECTMAEANIRTEWPKGTPFETIRNDLFNQLVQQANHLVDELEKRLLSAQPTQPQQAPSGIPPRKPTPLGRQTRTGSLPWFKHGVRGFLRKMWYGDHPNNPDWDKMDWTKGRMTIQEYLHLEKVVNEEIDELLEEANFTDAIRGYFDDFRKNLAELLKRYMIALYQVGQQNAMQATKGTDVPPEDVAPVSKGEEGPITPEPTNKGAQAPPEPTEPEKKKRSRRKEPSVKPNENLNPLQAILTPQSRKHLRKRPPLKASELEAALRFLHEHGYDITSPIDVRHAIEKLASDKYEDGGNLLALYGKAVGLDPNDDEAILAHLGIQGVDGKDPEHATPEEIRAEIERLSREKEQSGYDFRGTEGEPGNYDLGEPETEEFG